MKMKKAKRNMAIGYVIVMIPLLVRRCSSVPWADMGLINNALLLYIVSLGLNISLGLTGMSICARRPSGVLALIQRLSWSPSLACPSLWWSLFP